MKPFTDNRGRTWDVALNVTALKRVRDLCAFDLLKIVEDAGVIARLIDDPVLLVDVIYAICRPQAETRDISDEAFGESMAGDAIERATEALLEEIVGFFPEAKRGPLRKAISTMRALEAEALRAIEAAIDDPKIMDQARSNLASELTKRGVSSTSSPESSVLTPDP